jgi:hypothetical protein
MPALLLVLLVLGTIESKAQTLTSSVINTSGNCYSQGYYSFDWSIGEMAIVETMAANNTSNFITNGFLQPNKLAESTTQKFTVDEVKILPNPTFNHIEINFLTTQQGTLYINIYDGSGKNILGRRTASYGIGSIERFDLTRFPAGTYFVQIELKPVAGSVKKTGAYKIVKLS